MKTKISKVLFSIFLIINGFNSLLYAQAVIRESNRIIIDIPFEEIFTYKNTEGYTCFKGENIQFINKTGEPKLPSKVIKVLLPPEADMNTVTVSLKNERFEIFSEDCLILPTHPLVAKDGDKEIVLSRENKSLINGRDTVIYNHNTAFPQNVIGNISKGMMRKWKIIDIPVSLFKYNPITRKLYNLNNGQLYINYLKLSGIDIQKSSDNQYFSDKIFKEKVSRIVVNYNEFVCDYQNKTGNNSEILNNIGYAIITTNDIVNNSSELENFITQKENIGFMVFLITDDIWNPDGQTGDEASENIRNWLIDNYVSLSIEYVLLIGNPDPVAGDVPMKKLWPQSGLSYYPSDYYYSDLTGNWNLDNDSKYGEYPDDFGNGGVDKNYEVLVGRIPYYGIINDMDNILTKIFLYENEQNTSWRENVLLPMRRYYDNTRTYYLGEAIKDDILIPKAYGYYRIWDYNSAYPNCPYPEMSPINYDNVLNAWTGSQYGAVFWTSHGSATQANYVMNNTNVDLLDDTYPVFTFQASCNNSSPENSENLTYSLLKNGSIAAIGATRTSFLQFCQTEFAGTTSNQGLTYEYAKRLITYEMPCGYALNDMRQELYLGSWANFVVYNLYGDPSVGLYQINLTGIPDILLMQNETDLLTIDTLDLTLFDNTVSITIKNKGNVRLYLTGNPRVKIIGNDPDRFIISQIPPPTVSVNGEVTFEITYLPTYDNWHSAVVSIENNDPDQNPYEFIIKGGDKTIQNQTKNIWYYNIQDAIDEADDNDVILVSDGIYYPNEIIIDKTIVLKSMNGAEHTIIDGNNAHRCFYLNSANAVIDGFTITNGYEPFGNNTSGGGGGIYAYGGIIKNCIIENNVTSGRGGGIMCEGTQIMYCTIIRNHAYRGGGIYMKGTENIVDHTTVTLNSAEYNISKVGGIYDYFGSTITNTIVYHNINGNYCYYSNTAVWKYCCTYPAREGIGNSVLEPVFLDTLNNNYNLQTDSPCINTGDPDSPVDPDSTITDMGALYYGTTISIKVFLEGPYNGCEMSTTLNTNELLPLSQPYNVAPWNYNGSESVSVIPENIVDWVLIEFREADSPENASPDTQIALQAGFLLKNGNIVGLDGNSKLHFYISITKNLFAVIYHRNHLAIMSAVPFQISEGIYNYDFSISANQVYGGMNAYKDLGEGVFGMVGGDGDANGQIGNSDKNDIWIPLSGNTGYLQGDFNMDGQVCTEDKNDIWMPNSGFGSQILENASQGGYALQVLQD